MIEIKGLSKKYKNNILFENTDAVFEDDNITFIMGENGCGKTSLIKCLCGLESYSGSIVYDHNSESTDSRGSMLVIWDDCVFFRNLSGIDNLRIFDDVHSKEEIINIAGRYLSIEKLRKKVKKYSYGQKKMLSLALAELLKPKILIMDEVTNGLDYNSLKKLKRDLSEWKRSALIIMTGHNLDFYSAVADRLFLIKDRKLLSREIENEGLADIYDKEFY